jgi:hypothetical protein
MPFGVTEVTAAVPAVPPTVVLDNVTVAAAKKPVPTMWNGTAVEPAATSSAVANEATFVLKKLLKTELVTMYVVTGSAWMVIAGVLASPEATVPKVNTTVSPTGMAAE